MTSHTKDVTVTYSVDGGDKTEGTETEAAVEDGKTTKVEFQNDYTKQTGTLELTKTIRGDITKEEAEGALTFIVQSENGRYLDKNGDLVENEKDAVLTLKDFTYDEGADKYTLTIEKADLGHYTVTETTKDIDGKEYTVRYSVNGEAQEEGSEAAAAIEKDKTTTVDFEDDFTSKPGILELTKTILGDITEEEAEGALTFVITAKVTEGGSEVTKYLKADGTLSDTEVKLTLNDFEHDKGTDKYTLTITTSELGSYTVTETTKDIDGKDVTAATP